MSPNLFRATTNQIPHLCDTFNALTSVNTQAALIITRNGISLMAEYNHICNIELMVDYTLFDSYEFNEDHESIRSRSKQRSRTRAGSRGVGDSETESDSGGQEEDDDFDDSQPQIRVGVDLGVISDSLSVIKNANINKMACVLSLDNRDAAFTISYEDDKINEKVEFSTFFIDIDSFGLELNYNEIIMESVMKSDVYYNLLRDLKDINTEELFIYISNLNKVNQLNFISKGEIGYSKIIFPTEKTILESVSLFRKNDLLNSLDDDSQNLPTSASIPNSISEQDEMVPIESSNLSHYNFKIFIMILKAVKLSSRVRMLRDSNGLMSLNLLCKNLDLVSYTGSIIKFNFLEIFSDEDDIDLNNYFDDDSLNVIAYKRKVAVGNKENGHNTRHSHKKKKANRQNAIDTLGVFFDGDTNKVIDNVNDNDNGTGANDNSINDADDANDDDDNADDDDVFETRTEIAKIGGAVEVPLFL